MNKKRKTKPELEICFLDVKQGADIPLYSNTISAGFPSPADDYIERKLDLNEYLIRNNSSTFFVKVSGNSMVNAGIYNGDILIVDRSVEPDDGKIVIGVVNGDFTVKRILKKGKRLFLQPENEHFKPIEITESMDFNIWGVVTFTIHKH